jgi:hypothetical protein
MKKTSATLTLCPKSLTGTEAITDTRAARAIVDRRYRRPSNLLMAPRSWCLGKPPKDNREQRARRRANAFAAERLSNRSLVIISHLKHDFGSYAAYSKASKAINSI